MGCDVVARVASIDVAVVVAVVVVVLVVVVFGLFGALVVGHVCIPRARRQDQVLTSMLQRGSRGGRCCCCCCCC